MPKIDVLNLEGKSLRALELNEAVFGIEPNNQTIFDAVLLQRATLRQGTHATKNRSAVSGGGKKPWKQKGTGRARTGSIRAPQFSGGGVVFGPTPRKYGFKLNQKVRQLALRSALSQKVLNEAVKAVENLEVSEVKTQAFVKVMNNIEVGRKTLFVVATDEDVTNAALSLRNLQNASLLNVKHLNVYDILNANTLVFTEKAAIEAGEVFA